MLGKVLEEAVHTLRDAPHVIDMRNFGLAAAVELEPEAGQPGVRGIKVLERGLDEGLLLRVTGDTIAFAPPFISTPEEIQRMIESVRVTLRALS
jgi:beta-alanine--pyruvate transaminase